MHDKVRKGLDMIHLDAPIYIRTGSKGDSLEETRRLLKRQKFDHHSFNVFLATKFGQYLVEGIDNPEVDKLGITRLSQFIKAFGTYVKALNRSKDELSSNPVLSKIYKEN